MPELTTMHDIYNAFFYASQPKDPTLAVWYQGERYGGFMNEDHVHWWAEKAGIKYEELKIEHLEEMQKLFGQDFS